MKFREMRYPCDCPAQVLTPVAILPVVIVNISPHGARIARAEGLSPGDNVSLHMFGGRHTAQVRWVRHGLAGLRFETAITSGTLASVRKSSGTRQARTGWNLHLRELS